MWVFEALGLLLCAQMRRWGGKCEKVVRKLAKVRKSVRFLSRNWKKLVLFEHV